MENQAMMTTDSLAGPFTAAQAAVRDAGISGSDIGQLTCPDYPWGGPHRVWLQKTGRGEPSPDTIDTLYGRLMEEPCRTLYSLRTGYDVETPGTLVHPELPLIRATPDGLVAGDRVVEIKCPRYKTAWGEDGSHDIPPYYWPQITWEMAAAGVRRCDMVALFEGERGIRIYPDLPFDDELFEDLYAAALRFWRTYVSPDIEPPIDASAESSERLKRRYPTAGADWIDDDSAEIAQQVRQYADGMLAKKAAEAQIRGARNVLIERIGTHRGLRGTWGHINYSNVKPRLKTDWAAVEREAGIPAEIIQRHTAPGAPYRRFFPSIKGFDLDE